MVWSWFFGSPKYSIHGVFGSLICRCCDYPSSALWLEVSAGKAGLKKLLFGFQRHGRHTSLLHPWNLTHGTCLRWLFAFYHGKITIFHHQFSENISVTFIQATHGVQKIPNLETTMASGEAFRGTLGVYKDLLGHINGCGSVLWTPRVSGTTVAGWKQWFRDVYFACRLSHSQTLNVLSI